MNTSQPRPRRLFVGVGNLLRGDDGVGVRAAEELARQPLPPEVEVFATGTSAMELAAALEGRDLVVVADAIDLGGAAGEVYRLSPADLRPAARSGLSLHDLHLLDALAEVELLGRAPRRVVVLAVQIEDLGPRIGLSPRVEAARERVVELAARELGLCEAASAGAARAGSASGSSGLSGPTALRTSHVFRIGTPAQVASRRPQVASRRLRRADPVGFERSCAGNP